MTDPRDPRTEEEKELLRSNYGISIQEISEEKPDGVSEEEFLRDLVKAIKDKDKESTKDE